ncbi:hypothetical protein ACKI2N_023440 [Cupriavidus sp. 30B13]|uniref:hypothetical protein n=1 Tax=Cupriavidus sp. 30B13 TaxID=3384241 RepID=UPI003B8F55C4
MTPTPMNHRPPRHPVPDQLTSYFRSGDAIRSRRVSDIVLAGTVDIPMPPARLLADWAREISSRLVLEPGDVEAMPLARARTRWPDYARCVQAMAGWAGALGLPGVLAAGDIALMACRGARYHHDGTQYGGAAFCNLFVSEDKGQDVHFPALDLRIPLRRGTAILFDTCQPHGVIRRGSSGFHAADFPAGEDCTQLFLTWELPIEDARVGQALKVAFDTDPSTALQLEEEEEGQEEQVRLDGARVCVCPDSGRWHPAD